MMKQGKNLFDFFPDKSREQVLKAFNYLSDKSKGNLIRVFGENLDRRDIWFTISQEDRKRINSIVSNTLKNKINRLESGKIVKTKKVRKRKRNYDRENEIKMIKRTKLSFYDKVSDDLKKLYFKYYCEVFPVFKIKYDEASLSDKEILLREAIENSKKWRDNFIENNQGLVGYVAHNYFKIPVEDLMQEGNIGMLHALEKFDVEKGVRFSSYAVIWIKRYIRNISNEQGSSVRMPVNVGSVFSKLGSLEYEYYKENKCFPDDEKLAELGSCALNLVEYYRKFVYCLESPYSFDAPISSESDTLLRDFIIDDNLDLSVENEIIAEEIKDWIDLNISDEKKRFILTKRLDLDGNGVYSCRQIAKVLGVSAQYISSTENKCLDVIRNEFINQEENREKDDILFLKRLKNYYLSGMSIDDIAKELELNEQDVIQKITCIVSKIKSEYEIGGGTPVKKR